MLDDPYLRAAVSLEDHQLEQLITSYWNDVWNFVYVMIRQRDSADDLTQETFVRAFRSLSSFKGQSSYRTWLLRIARNLTINYKRSAFFRRVILAGDLLSNRSSASAEAEYWRWQELDEIWQQVFRLPAKHREVLLLDAKYGLSMQEMAELLQVPEGTVKSRLNRARKRMADWLKGEQEHE
ncbi:RNA polymerase sigma factor [Cohnella nanjingensis]|uniref:RNA polymerase sigma factor n=1 Tax=Cohnella nanjingensis TaxID=1387779 RepID=A0A7X0RWB2_9BACL|nr:sigma-70 family RNA polymerase sigma factor [Cohnella nanjingensis]MBB6674879.1 sigma-70 family RNA polymerase sigma factor [Cohnella nanjingensis]